MISLKRVLLNNIVVHKNTEFVFEPGITVIRGQNGSGKSILFNSISNVLNGVMPTSNKKHDYKAVHDTDSVIEVDFNNADVSYEVSQESSGKNLVYKIKKNNEDVDPRTISIANDYLSKIFPVSVEGYFSLIHLLPYRGNIIRTGSGSQRKQFFEQMFNLKYSEDILLRLKSKLADLQQANFRKTTYEEQLSSLTFTENLEEKEDELKNVSAKFNAINSEYQTNNIIVQKLNSIKTLKDTLITGKPLEELQEYKDKFDKKLKKIKHLKDELALQVKNYEENDLLIDEINSLKKALSDEKFNSLTRTVQEYQDVINKINLLIPEKEKQYQDALENNSAYKDMQALEQTVNLIKASYSSYDDAMQDISNAVSETQKQNNLINKLTSVVDSTECPLCGSHLNKEDIIRLINNARKIIDGYSNLILNKDKILSYYKLKEQNIELIDDKAILDKLASLKNKLNAAKEKLMLAKEKESLELRFNSMPKIKNLEEPDKSKLIEYDKAIEKGESLILNIVKDIDTFNYMQSLKEDLKQYKGINFKELSSKNSQIINELSALSETKARLSTEITLAKDNNNKITELKSKLNELDKSVADIPIYEALIKAYGPKGIKIDQIRYIAEAFCSNLNKYASLLFNKKIAFSVNVDNTNFNIYYEIEGRKTSDVSTMSGAESRLFMLLCLISLLPFISEKMRTDTVILDEVESGMSDETRKFVSENFYKELLNIVPKIIIVTPMSQKEFFVNSDREYVIENKGKSSILRRVL